MMASEHGQGTTPGMDADGAPLAVACDGSVAAVDAGGTAACCREPLRGMLWAGWTLGLSSLASAACAPLPAERRDGAWDPWVRLWAHGLHVLAGLDVRSGGCASVPATGARLVVANHRSPLDVTLLLSRFGGCCLSRADLGEWPVVGRAARRAGTIFVDRDDRRSGAAAIRQIRTRLRAGRTVILFPEGTTSRGDRVRSFQAGALAAARGLDVEVVPVGLAYPSALEFDGESFEGFVRRISGLRGAGACLQVGRARRLDGGDVRGEAGRLRAEVQALVVRARRLCRGAASSWSPAQ